MSSTLHMIRVSVSTEKLVKLAHTNRWPIHELDLGYMVHAHLAALFGDLAPSPFSIDDFGSPVSSRHENGTMILGYAQADMRSLESHAQAFADPDVWGSCDWSNASSKPMPIAFEDGQRLGFRVRICPVVRTKSERQPRGREIDAFLARCIRVGREENVEREKVYVEWLKNDLERNGDCELESAQLVRFERGKFLRRTQGDARRTCLVERPDAVVDGILRIRSTEQFVSLLKRGVGRHRAFGFGMLLLRPARKL